ncbi:MAG: LCP family protein, partial [Ktedonobacteraceae bacterium]|nr:LCP family protein [Ktedonobacteraceae bacterium]
MKRQFAQIQPSKLSDDPQQGSLSEGQSPEEERTAPASPPPPERFTPPPPQEAMGKSPVPYWTREERHAPPMNQASTQRAPGMQGQNVPPFVAPPVAPRPSYGSPTHPALPPGQRPAGPMHQNNVPPMVYPQYGPPRQPALPPGQRPGAGPMLQNNAPFMQGPLVKIGKASRKKRRFPIWARVVVAIVSVLLIGGGTAFGYYQANFADPLGKITGQQAAQIGMDGKSTNQMATTGDGIGNQRVNILLLGSDNDGKNAAPLAQTDIVVTIDPQTHYVGMLSIPRDLRVVIPRAGAGKMDAAFSFGWQGNFGGATPLSNAAGLSIATVEKNFGIHIDHYAWVGLNGFVKVINTAGGVDIDATHPITDNAYPNDVNNADRFGYKRLYITPGPQHMNGVQALEYVRTRHADLVGDFGRSARQQQVLSQLKTKLDTTSIITKLPDLA